MISGGFNLGLVISDPFSPCSFTFRQQKQKYVCASAAQGCCLMYQSKTIDERDLSEYPSHTLQQLRNWHTSFCISATGAAVSGRGVGWYYTAPLLLFSREIVGENHSKGRNIFLI